jgi:hypothetical protein
MTCEVVDASLRGPLAASSELSSSSLASFDGVDTERNRPKAEVSALAAKQSLN